MAPANAKSRLKIAVTRLMPPRALGLIKSKRERLRLKVQSAVNDPMQFERRSPRRECPICGYRGRFWSFGSPPRAEALCPACLSLERHRLLQLLIEYKFGELSTARRILHFAPEPFVREELRRVDHYVTADITGHGVDCACAMEALPFADRAFGTVIANHVLEHVSDESRALAELKRVVDRGGLLILSVPQVQGWATTYEDESITDPSERRVHFGQEDHRRLYGRDFARRLQQAGFDVKIFQMDQKSEVRYGLNRGETLFLTRPAHAAGAPAAATTSTESPQSS